MENATQSSRPDARIIYLRTPDKQILSEQHTVHQPMIMDLHTLEYIDQLLDEHFKWNEQTK